MAIVLLFSLSSVVTAAPTSPTSVEGPSFSVPLNGDDPIIVPYDATLIPSDKHTGTGAYKKSFTLSLENGDNLNIWVQNNKSSGTVYFQVKRLDGSNQNFGAEAVGASSQLTRSFTMTGGGGMQGTWEVYVYTTDGHNMDITVAARQY